MCISEGPEDDPIRIKTCCPNTIILTYSMAQVLLEKLTGFQLVKKFPAIHGTRKFITALKSVRQLSLSWASPIQSIYPHPTSWRSILILSTQLRLGLPSGSFPPVSPSRPYTPPLLTHTRNMPSPSHLKTYWGKKCTNGFIFLLYFYIRMYRLLSQFMYGTPIYTAACRIPKLNKFYSLFFCLRVVFPSHIFAPVSVTKILYSLLVSSASTTCQTHTNLFH